MSEGALDLTRSRDLGELLGTTFALLRRHLDVFFTVTAIVMVPVVLLVDGVWDRQLVEGPAGSGNLAPGLVSAALQLFVVPALVTALHVRIVQGLAVGVEPTVRSALSAIWSAGPRAIAATTVYALGMLAGFLLLIVPGVIWMVRWYFSPQAAVVDGLSPHDARAVSSELVAGRWWPVAGRLLAVWTIAFLLFGVPAMVLGYAFDGPFPYVAATCVLQTLSASLGALFGTLLFFTLRTLHDVTTS